MSLLTYFIAGSIGAMFKMAKRRIRVTVNHELISAPVWEMTDLHWNDNKLGCPFCGIFSSVKAELDIIQFALDGNDSIHTIIRCEYCANRFAAHYINTGEIEE